MPPDGPTTKEDTEARLARVVAEQRTRLLRRHAHRLTSDDLDECFSQAVLELVPRARREPPDTGWHPGRALERRFGDRVSDRRRALAGRSPRERVRRSAPDSDEASIDEVGTLADPGATVDDQIVQRDELSRLLELIADLPEDQRLVATFRMFGDGDADAWRIRQGWSPAKFEKTASRARAALTALRAEYDSGERCIRLAPELHAVVVGNVTREQRARAARHVRNCRPCAASMLAAKRWRKRRSRNGDAAARGRGPGPAEAPIPPAPRCPL